GNYSISIGYDVNSGTADINSSSVTIGYLAEAGDVVIGSNASGNISIGQNTISSITGISIGGISDISVADVVLIGVGSSSIFAGSTVVGTNSTSIGGGGIAIGHTVSAAQASVALGANSISTANSISIGKFAASGTGVKSNNFVAIGHSSGKDTDVGLSSTAVGYLTTASEEYSIALGYGASATQTNGISIGKNITNAGINSVAILATVDTSSESIAFGISSSVTNSSKSVVIGRNSHATAATNSIAFGNAANTSAASAIAIGTTVSASAIGAIVMGSSTTATAVENSTVNSIGFGWTVATPSILFAQATVSYINNNAGLVLGSDTITANTILELSSADKALLITRVADPSSNIAVAVDGMIAYSTNDSQLQAFISGVWKNIGGAGINPTGTAFRLSRFTSAGDDIEESIISNTTTQVGIGTTVNLTRNGEVVQSNGNFTTNGDAQSAKMVARAQTTNATPVEMFLDGISEVINITTNSVLGFNINIIALETDAPAGTNGTAHSTKIAQYKGGIKNIGTTVSLVDTVTEILLAEDGFGSNWSVSVTASGTVAALKIEVIGEAGVNINWVATIETVETRS
ncbi:MAG: hypothetical protein DRQ35_06815, partial [Gammaproteobacteria bacterium]